MQNIYVLRGLPGSGKTTYAREFVKSVAAPEEWVRLNKDDLRMMMHEGVYSKGREKFVHETFMKLVQMALSSGKNVIVDNTHITNDSVKPYHRLAEQLGNIQVSEQWIRVSLEECLRRNSLREGVARVPDDVIMTMAQKIGLSQDKFYKNRKNTSVVYPEKSYVQGHLLEQDETLPGAVICDLDGTLALLNGRNPYDASTCCDDDLNKAVHECLMAMMNANNSIIFVSGRSDMYKEQTIAFIEKHCVEQKYPFAHTEPFFGPIDYQLFMRREGDTRKDAIVKQEIFDEHIRSKYNVKFVLDDRDQVVEFWRSIGLPCFQVAPGDF